MRAERIYLMHDPLDRWVRIGFIEFTYKEPASSVHDMIAKGELKAKTRNGVKYVNERHYQNLLNELPDAPKTQSKPRRNVRAESRPLEMATGGDHRSAKAARAILFNEEGSEGPVGQEVEEPRRA